MIDKYWLFILACMLPALACGGEIYRWTDDTGQVHYGDTVPSAYQRAAKPVDLNNVEVSDEERQAAAVRLLQEKNLLQQNAESAQPPAPAPQPAPAENQPGSCEEQWLRYDASWACFNPYRTAYGAVKAEAFKHCTEIKAPSCTREAK
ncbi:DUF4124 domain-containing protein [Rhodocyclus tenuis]|uniref:DUF4124 domain-containing protein n=1 Tax=Rhodocyclus tenuis TaxID=1066 RepID=A0A840GIF7_RHOTE|nr:DUF4124 domain-containing protein [Rhodocyclus tenuis]MBB4248252.1 hypothetical protein [Rhodocyclus tenuis]